MNTDIALWKVLVNMPENLKIELLHYAESLLEKYPNIKQVSEQTETNHGYGSWKGQIIISDDFDEPLEDLQEYM